MDVHFSGQVLATFANLGTLFAMADRQLEPRRIAMWSGPRNISTALMRSFDSRADTYVTDEPLYAYYLNETGLKHPIASKIISTNEPNFERVIQYLHGPVPSGQPVWYQKHMSHHILPSTSLDWLDGMTHAFLVREPRAMLASLCKKLGIVALEETGLPQQVELYRMLTDRLGFPPPVVDAREIQMNPRSVLQKLCGALDLEFTEGMLSWEAGSRPTDGCWGPLWYENTLVSTGFTPYQEKSIELPDAMEGVAARAEEHYAELVEHAIRG